MTLTNPTNAQTKGIPSLGFGPSDLRSVDAWIRRDLEKFFGWIERVAPQHVDRMVFLQHAASFEKRTKLRGLSKALVSLFPQNLRLHDELREAWLEQERAWRGDPTRVEVLSAAWWKPLIGRANTEALRYEQLKIVDRWFAHLFACGISFPVVADYLAYFKNVKSARPMVDLQASFTLLKLPASPSVVIELPIAIATKRSSSASCAKMQTRAVLRSLSVGADALPETWRATLAAMREGKPCPDLRSPTPSTVAMVEKVLCQLAHHCVTNGQPVQIDVETVGSYLTFLEQTRMKNGLMRRPATLKMRILCLEMFSRHLELPREIVDALKVADARRRHDLKGVVAKKHTHLAAIGSVQVVLRKAVELLGAASSEKTMNWRKTRLNHATSLALFVLVPVRLSDTKLIWGESISHCEAGYTVGIETNKTGQKVSSVLPAFLNPFLDAILLEGLDQRYLDEARSKAISNRLPLFTKSKHTETFDNYVSHAWPSILEPDSTLLARSSTVSWESWGGRAWRRKRCSDPTRRQFLRNGMTLSPRMKAIAPSASMAWIAVLRASLSEANWSSQTWLVPSSRLIHRSRTVAVACA